MGFFKDAFMLRGAAPYFQAWKDAFTAKVMNRFPYSVRDSGNEIMVNHKAQQVRVLMQSDASDVHVQTEYSSVLVIFGFLLLFGALASLLVNAIVIRTSWWNAGFWGIFAIPGSIVFFMTSFLLFGINEEMNIHKPVAYMARKAWEELQVQLKIVAPPVVTMQARPQPPGGYVQSPEVPAPATSAPKPPVQFCSFCGANRAPGARFCEGCGAEFP